MSLYEKTAPKPKVGLEVMMHLFNVATQEVFQIIEVSSGGYVTLMEVESLRVVYKSQNQLRDFRISGVA